MTQNSPLTLQAADGARVQVHAQGAHVSSWRCAAGIERLFLSSRSSFAAGAAIRGGVPVIFPQFADLGPLPKHGFARTQLWSLLEQSAGSMRWVLESSGATTAIWPHRFRCELAIAVGAAQLQLELSVINTGDQLFSFTAALHTYLRVDDIADVRVIGLQNLRYRDKTRRDAEAVEHHAALPIAGEVDRIYFDAPPQLQVIENQRSLTVAQQGFTDTVIWNPGEEKGAALSDLEAGGYRRMLCVEAAAVGRPIELAPGQGWSGSQTLRS